MPAGSLGELIRHHRTALGLTQEQLAERVSERGETIRQADISRIETGLVEFPRRPRLETIAAALGLSFGDLLEQTAWFESEDVESEHGPSDPQPRPDIVQHENASQRAGAPRNDPPQPAQEVPHHALHKVLMDSAGARERFQRNVELVEANRSLFIEAQTKLGRGKPPPQPKK